MSLAKNHSCIYLTFYSKYFMLVTDLIYPRKMRTLHRQIQKCTLCCVYLLIFFSCVVKRERCSTEEILQKSEKIVSCFKGLKSYKLWFFFFFLLFNLRCINPLQLFEHFLHMKYRLLYYKSVSVFSIPFKYFR